jgi:hypothetical protein
VAKVWFGCTVVSYTHYPTISTDMLQAVQERRPSYNNDQRVSGSLTASKLKLVYYKVSVRVKVSSFHQPFSLSGSISIHHSCQITTFVSRRSLKCTASWVDSLIW